MAFRWRTWWRRAATSKSVVLARAVKWHAEHRILLNGGRTVIFR